MTALQSLRLDKLDSRIRAVWRRGQLLYLLDGLLAFVRWAVPMAFAGMAIDWLVYMPTPGRVIMLVTILVVAFYRAWRCGWRHLRRFDARRTALQLEEYHGNLESLLVSALQFREGADYVQGSRALRERACRQAEDAAADVSPKQTVSYRALRRPAIIAASLAGVIALFAAVNGPFLTAGLVRIFAPWTQAKYPTYTQITLEQDHLVIKEGDRAEIRAQLDGVIPDKAVIFVQTGEGRAREIVLEVAEDQCSYTIASASRDFEYRIKAGDDRTDWHRVRVIRAPRVQSAKVELNFPAYLDRAPDTTQALTLTVPEGTSVAWQLTLDQAVSAAQFMQDGLQPVELEVDDNGRIVNLRQDVSASRGYRFSWVEKANGFDFESPRYFLQVSADQAPRIELTSPASNLVAMVGRPLNMTVRAHDDHGIASTQIAYRVNKRNETVVDLPSPAETGQGDQPIDWDYRQAIPDLEVGDTVSFTLIASDRYPGPQGPHVVRSDTRQITFLSKEDYLAQIQDKQDRLLSRVQALYRQQRAAHDNIRALDPVSGEFVQACQMEAIRQELVREQLKDVAAKLQALLDDLADNNVADASADDSLAEVRTALIEIADGHTANAASLLREQSAIDRIASAAAEPSDAAREVNAAARALASLVLLGSIDSAQEVFARETRMLAEVQASLRWRTVVRGPSDSTESLAAQQRELAQWTDELITGLLDGMHYDKRPLAVLRLVRRVNDLRDANAAQRSNDIVAAIEQDKIDHASRMQADLMRTYLNAEFSIRITGAYSTLIRTRNQMRLLAQNQAELRGRCARMTSEDFEQGRPEIMRTQAALRKQLLTMLLPTVPAPRAELFDQSPPQPPPADALLLQVDSAMAETIQQIEAGQKDAVRARQYEVEQTLDELIRIVERWSVQLGLQTQGLGTLVAATSERLSVLEAYEIRALTLLEKSDIATAEEKPVTGLSEPQQLLVEEIIAFGEELAKQNQAEPDPHIPPLLGRLAHVERAMDEAIEALEQNGADRALEQQEVAADALAQARELVEAQNAQLALLQGLLLFQRAVGFSNDYMSDTVAQQRDLLAATEASEPEAMSQLQPQFRHMLDCLVDVAPLLDFVAGRMDVGTPLAFAQVDFEDVIASVESGDKFNAIDAQQVAAESLEELQALIAEIRTQTGYIAEIISYLHDTVTESTALQYEQEDLLNRVATAPADSLSVLADEQEALIARAEQLGERIELATGMPEFTEVPKQMREALGHIHAKDSTGAIEAMQLVLETYGEDKESLLKIVSALNALPISAINEKSQPELVRLIDVLAVASNHKQILRDTHDANAEAMHDLQKLQKGLADRGKQIAAQFEPHPILDASNEHLSAAAAAFEADDRAILRRSQKVADKSLLHFVVEQALFVYAPPGQPPPIPPAEAEIESDAEIDLPGFIADFVSGEVPQDKRSGWQVLGDRNRAALNQNFARELPLEYRDLLKNYYERVAR